jgi:hypothetical protein
MSQKIHPINHQHLTADDPLDWDPLAALTDSALIHAIYVKFATSPAEPDELLSVTYTPPTDAAGVAGVETVVDSIDPSKGANDTEKQNVVFNINQRYSAGGILSVKYLNTDTIATIDISVSYDPSPNM